MGLGFFNWGKKKSNSCGGIKTTARKTGTKTKTVSPKVLGGKVQVTKNVKSNRIRGVWDNGKFYTPKHSWSAEAKKNLGRPRQLSGSKTLYYRPKNFK